MYLYTKNAITGAVCVVLSHAYQPFYLEGESFASAIYDVMKYT